MDRLSRLAPDLLAELDSILESRKVMLKAGASADIDEVEAPLHKRFARYFINLDAG